MGRTSERHGADAAHEKPFRPEGHAQSRALRRQHLRRASHISLKQEIRWALRGVLESGTRRRALLRLGVPGMYGLARFLLDVVPQAQTQLATIKKRAEQIPDAAFRNEALTSIEGKAYHVAGGAFLAAFLPKARAAAYVRVIAPLESLYDYLDNLCDRHPDVPLEAYPVLHEALRDAVDPHRETTDYFRAGPATNDGGYLAYLVAQTREALRDVPNHEALQPYLREACDFYTALQTYKHYPPAARVAALQGWHAANLPRFSQLTWWEFAAACGSQFHIYVMYYFCLQGEPGHALEAYDAYFPEFCALHVLLDDFIDQAEDNAHGELNFVTRYASFEVMKGRFTDLVHIARAHIARLADPSPHLLLLRVLTLFYLTHPKVYAEGLDEQAQALLTAFE